MTRKVFVSFWRSSPGMGADYFGNIVLDFDGPIIDGDDTDRLAMMIEDEIKRGVMILSWQFLEVPEPKEGQ